MAYLYQKEERQEELPLLNIKVILVTLNQFVKQFRTVLRQSEETENIVQAMKKVGVIELSTRPGISPLVMVKKKDGTTRFCVDYRLLNNITKKDSYSLSNIRSYLAH